MNFVNQYNASNSDTLMNVIITGHENPVDASILANYDRVQKVYMKDQTRKSLRIIDKGKK